MSLLYILAFIHNFTNNSSKCNEKYNYLPKTYMGGKNFIKTFFFLNIFNHVLTIDYKKN